MWSLTFFHDNYYALTIARHNFLRGYETLFLYIHALASNISQEETYCYYLFKSNNERLIIFHTMYVHGNGYFGNW